MLPTRQGLAELYMVRFFPGTSPSMHGMVVKLKELGLGPGRLPIHRGAQLRKRHFGPTSQDSDHVHQSLGLSDRRNRLMNGSVALDYARKRVGVSDVCRTEVSGTP